MEYIISGTGNLFNDGVKIKGVNKKNIELIKNTFGKNKYPRTVDKLVAAVAIKLEYKIVEIYGLTMLRQDTLYKFLEEYTSPNSVHVKKRRYFSNISTVADKNDGSNLNFVAIENNFNFMHITETYTSKNCKNFVFLNRRFLTEHCHIVEKNNYERLIKEVLLKIRLK